MPRHALRFAAAATGLALVVTSCSPRQAPPPAPTPRPSGPTINDGRSLLSAMREKYGGRWFKTASILQNNTFYSARGTETKSDWRQRIAVPGKLRIDYLPATQRSGVLFDGSRVHVFDNGRAIDSRPGVNALLLLAADVYVQPTERTTQLLDSLGFNLATLRQGTWEGRPAYVVGAAAGDTTTSQFWIDTERLTVVRVIQRERQGTRSIVQDVRFGQYREFAGFPIATDVAQYRDGRLVFRERYADVKVDEPIADATFDPTKWVAGVPPG